MKNGHIIKKAKQIIKDNKINAENIAFTNLNTLLENPTFKKLYREKKQAEIENAKCQAFGIADKYDLNKIEQQIDSFLTENNLSKNYLIPNYSCKKCNDTGMIENKMCSCLKNVVNKLLLEESGIKHKLFTFNDALPTNNTKIIFEKMEQWCDKKSKILNILFTGNTGTGKTFLMECMADKLIKNGNMICWATAFNLNQDLLSYRTALEQDKLQYIEKYLSTEYLFIDDLGTEPQLKNVTKEGLYMILSERMENNLATIITTNLDLGEIESTYDERFFSRLLQKNKSITLEIINEDLRIKGVK